MVIWHSLIQWYPPISALVKTTTTERAPDCRRERAINLGYRFNLGGRVEDIGGSTDEVARKIENQNHGHAAGRRPTSILSDPEPKFGRLLKLQHFI